MSEVITNIPDDGWFQTGCNTAPTDKQLCVIIHAFGDRTPTIMQYRKADWLYKDSDYFLDVSEKWNLDSLGCGDDLEPGFAPMRIVDKWKPLGLPQEDNERILKEIDSWFDEE